MLASMRQIEAIKSLNKMRNLKHWNFAVSKLYSKLLLTKKITLVETHFGKSENFNFHLTFACTRVGYEILNEAINLTMSKIAGDKQVTLEYEGYNVTFVTPVFLKQSGYDILEKCRCIKLHVRTTDMLSRTRALSYFNECAMHFI